MQKINLINKLIHITHILKNKYTHILLRKVTIIIITSSALCPLVTTTTPLSAQISRYENQVIDSINIIMEDTLNENTGTTQTIKKRLKTRVGDIFSQTAFDADLKMLSQDYDKIEPIVESKNGIITIEIHLWKNPTINKIYWQGNKSFPCTKLLEELGIATGSTYSRQKFSKAFGQVKSFYVQKGYFEAQLNYNVEHDPVTNEVDITICIDEGRAGKIEEVQFCNFSKKEKRDISNLIMTKKYNFFLSWMTGQGHYNEEMIQHDEFMVINYLQNQGYADARVKIDVIEAQAPDKISVRITAERGEYYKIGNIKLEGNTLYTEEELSSCLRIKTGGAYAPDCIHETVRLLTNKYGRCGYIEAIINYEATLSDEPYTYDIKISISEGESFRVGLIKVFGNCSTQTKVILHETLLVPGEVFNLEKLQLTEARLRNIGYFKNVNVYAVKSEETKVLPGNFRDVHIEVEEGSTGSIGAFCGFSNSDSLFAGVNLTEKNFNIAGFKCLRTEGFSALRGGGEYAHITLNFGTKTNSYVLSWTKPHFMDTPWTFGFDIDRTYNNFIDDDYEILGYGLTVHATYDYNAYVRVGTHYRLRNTHTHIRNSNSSSSSTSSDSSSSSGSEHHHESSKSSNISECSSDTAKSMEHTDALLSAIGMSWYYDSTDHPMFATRGYKSCLEGELAGLGGERVFISTAYLNSYFIPLKRFGVLKLRADAQFIQLIGSGSPSDIPLDERFYLGGNTTVRGYRPFRLGEDFKEWDSKHEHCEINPNHPKGGISLQLLSAEITRPLFSRVMGFVFADSGSVSMSRWSVGTFYSSVGYGCHIQVLDGAPPVTLGMGYPLNEVDKSDRKRFFITIGGKF